MGRGSSHQLESPKSDERLGWRGRTKERGGQGEFWHLYLSNWIEGRALGVSGGEGVEKRVCEGDEALQSGHLHSDVPFGHPSRQLL